MALAFLISVVIRQMVRCSPSRTSYVPALLLPVSGRSVFSARLREMARTVLIGLVSLSLLRKVPRLNLVLLVRLSSYSSTSAALSPRVRGILTWPVLLMTMRRWWHLLAERDLLCAPTTGCLKAARRLIPMRTQLVCRSSRQLGTLSPLLTFMWLELVQTRWAMKRRATRCAIRLNGIEWVTTQPLRVF